jgi:hypothetical protein
LQHVPALASRLAGDVRVEPLLRFVFRERVELRDGFDGAAPLWQQWTNPPEWKRGESPHRKAGRRPRLRALEGDGRDPEPPSGAPPGHTIVPAEPFGHALEWARRASTLSRAGSDEGLAEALDEAVTAVLLCGLPREEAMSALNNRKWIPPLWLVAG